MNILVTGCSRGVGLEICRVLLEQGNTVYGVARIPMNLRNLKSNTQVVSSSSVLTFLIAKVYARQSLRSL